MNAVYLQLSRAAFWARFAAVLNILFFIVILLFVIGTFPFSEPAGIRLDAVLTTLIFGVFFGTASWLFNSYAGLCRKALASGSAGDLERACRRQRLILICYGVLCITGVALSLIGMSVSVQAI